MKDPDVLAEKIENHFARHGVRVRLTFHEDASHEKQYLYSIKLKAGAKESKVFSCAPDIQTALKLPTFHPFKNNLNIWLLVSARAVNKSDLKEMLESEEFQIIKKNWKLPIALGHDMMGRMHFADLAEMPHAMYAGATFSGKSVGLMAMIFSLIYGRSASRVNLILFDVGANSMEFFDGIPHLSHPIVKDTETGIYVITSLVSEMERRIQLSKDEFRKLPRIVCIIDEYVSLIANISDKITSDYLSNAISNLLRRGRHGKIHMVLATQDPSTRNMKVDIGNITARMAFRCAKYNNSITILGENGAEKLLGKGAMLFKSSEYPTPIRLQGAFISTIDARRAVAYIKMRRYTFDNMFRIPELDASDSYIPTTISPDGSLIDVSRKKELVDIILWTLGQDIVSASKIMKQFSMSNRAYGIIDKLCEMELVSAPFAKQPRDVLSQSIEDIPVKVLAFLEANKVSKEEIEEVFASRRLSDI